VNGFHLADLVTLGVNDFLTPPVAEVLCGKHSGSYPVRTPAKHCSLSATPRPLHDGGRAAHQPSRGSYMIQVSDQPRVHSVRAVVSVERERFDAMDTPAAWGVRARTGETAAIRRGDALGP